MEEQAVLDAEAADVSAETALVVSVPRVLGMWLPTPSRRRLLDHDVELIDSVDDGVDLILASTRGPAGLRDTVTQLLEHGVPVVVICHPGGEPVAAQFVAKGAITVVAEGNEAQALNVLEGTPSDHLVEAYLAEIDRDWSGAGPIGAHDAVTNLPTRSAFELRLAELGKDGAVPRLGLVEVSNEEITRQFGATIAAGIRRRLAMGLLEIASHARAEVFDLGDDLLAFLAPHMSVAAATVVARDVVALGSAFAPSGEPMDVAVGTAGPESAGDVGTLRMLAARALDAARQREDRYIDADALAEYSAASVELDAAVKIADIIDALDPRGEHMARVGAYALDIAREMQLEPIEVARIGLAARLHDIGKLSFGPAAFDPSQEQHDRAVKEHPARGEEYVIHTAGAEVAAMIRAHHERWDGEGHPDGLAQHKIPYGARVIAVAEIYDLLALDGRTSEEIESRLREEAGHSLDPELVEAALSLFGHG